MEKKLDRYDIVYMTCCLYDFINRLMNINEGRFLFYTCTIITDNNQFKQSSLSILSNQYTYLYQRRHRSTSQDQHKFLTEISFLSNKMYD